MRARLWLAFKVVATGALLFWALRTVDLDGVAAALGSLGGAAIAAVVGLTFAAVAVSAWRWTRVLRRLGENVTWPPLFGDTLVGMTYNLLLPTSVGGDVIRSVRCRRRLRAEEHAWASVAFERVMGLVSLALVSAVGLLSATARVRNELLLLSIGIAGGLVLALLVAPNSLRLAGRAGDRLGLDRLAQTLHRMGDAFAGPLATPGARLETFGWSLLYQGVSLAILFAAGLGWTDVDAWRLARAVFLGVPIALVLATAPITIGGFGLRESLFVTVLAPFGIAADRAFALSLVWLASNLVGATVGLVLTWRSPGTEAPPSGPEGTGPTRRDGSIRTAD